MMDLVTFARLAGAGRILEDPPFEYDNDADLEPETVQEWLKENMN